MAADIRVVIADDHPIFRHGLQQVVEAQPDMQVVAAVGDGATALEVIRRSSPDVAVLDVRMPGLGGLELQSLLNGAGATSAVVFMTGHGDVQTGVRAMKSGAVDFLLKPVDGATLLRAVEDSVARDTERLAQEREREAIRDRLRGLSPRERQVLADVVRGLPNKLTAADLGISEKTVKVHRHRIMAKTGASSLAELVRLVDAGGL